MVLWQIILPPVLKGKQLNIWTFSRASFYVLEQCDNLVGICSVTFTVKRLKLVMISFKNSVTAGADKLGVYFQSPEEPPCSLHPKSSGKGDDIGWRASSESKWWKILEKPLVVPGLHSLVSKTPVSPGHVDCEMLLLRKYLKTKVLYVHSVSIRNCLCFKPHQKCLAG